MDAAAKSFLYDLLKAPSPTGFEAPGQRVWTDYVRGFADRVESDTYGSAWAILDGQTPDAPTVLLEAHADEIGFMVKYVSDKGFLYVDRIGGSDRAIARAKRITILGDDGPVLGIIGNTAIHIRDTKDEKAPEWHELFVDVGASSADDVAARGIRVGHPAVYATEPEALTEKRLTGRALDNRVGGFVVAQALRRLAEEELRPACRVVALNSVQEEIGGHGAAMATYHLDPAAALVIDVTHATDSPGIDQKKHGAVTLGGGPSITHGTSSHPRVVERLMRVAGEREIPLQHEASSRYTGTDTDSVFKVRRGVASALISLPLRYMHSPAEVVDLGDVERCIDLMVGFAASVAADEAFRVAV